MRSSLLSSWQNVIFCRGREPRSRLKEGKDCRLKCGLLVCLCWMGYPAAATHRRRPATAPRVRFELLGRPPGPVRASLDHLDTPDSSDVPIWTQGLARTPVQHEPPRGSDPALKPSTEASLPEAGLQGAPPTPAERKRRFSGL